MELDDSYQLGYGVNAGAISWANTIVVRDPTLTLFLWRIEWMLMPNREILNWHGTIRSPWLLSITTKVRLKSFRYTLRVGQLMPYCSAIKFITIRSINVFGPFVVFGPIVSFIVIFRPFLYAKLSSLELGKWCTNPASLS
jgi:hypothetical protein